MREEYPRPELVRDSYICLNGEWEFCFDFCNGKKERVKEGIVFDMKINVPFCPESKLSGIGYTDFINGCCYKKIVKLLKSKNKRIILNFEAVFYNAEVYINKTLSAVHNGGYTPFSVDITDLAIDGDNEIIVITSGDARNPLQPSGKQCDKLNSFGCFYSRCSGIWQTVWIEYVNETYLQNYKVYPDIANNCTYIDLNVIGNGAKTILLEAKLSGKCVGKEKVLVSGNQIKVKLPLKKIKLWDTENPTLYDLEIKIETKSGCDFAKGYFALREISLGKNGLSINGNKTFMRLVLDQGYYKDGVYTAPTEQHLINDILITKRLGFNGARLHQKTFERRFLYHADRLGYIVWGEYASWGFDFTRDDALQYFLPEWLEVLDRDFNHPSIVLWCPFNETWEYNKKRQNDTFIKQLYEITKRLDATRPCIDTSGGYHVKTDIFDTHCYEQRENVFNDIFADFSDQPFQPFKEQEKYNGEPYMLSEYGGFKWPISNDGWGYGDAPQSEEEFLSRFISFTKTLLSNPRICGLCYTQLYDVEQEQNGIYFYDRTPKFSDKMLDVMAEEMKKISAFEKEK